MKITKTNFLIFYFFLALKFYITFESITFKIGEALAKTANDAYEKNFTENKFLIDFYYNNITVLMDFGTPEQHVKISLNFSDKCFFFTERNCDTKYIFNYNMIKSNTSKYLETYVKNFRDYVVLFRIEDVASLVNFDGESTSLKEQKMEAFIALDNDEKFEKNRLCGKLGFGVDDSEECPNFINSLKSKDIINSYLFYIDYGINNEKTFNGHLKLGDTPDILVKKNKGKKYVKETIIKKNNKFEWGLKFQKIYFIQDDKEYNVHITESYLSINKGLIIAPDEYHKIIYEIYFKNLINNNICNKYTSELLNGEETFTLYKCNQNSYQHIKKFPPIKFFSQNFNIDFTLTYEDLFKKIKDKIYFKIIFSTDINKKYWELGRPFLRKNIFIYDKDNKAIGLLVDNKIEEPIKIPQQSKVLLIIKILIIILLIVGAFFIGYKIRKERKKRIYELENDDFYDFVNKQNKNKDNELLTNTFNKTK